MSEWLVIPHKLVKKEDIPKLEKAGLMGDFNEIVSILKENPYSRVRRMEKLSPKNKEIYSMRVNIQHRVVYTIDKSRKIVKIWSAWSHYEQRLPKK
ncbi:addiction module toxin YoeB [Streptococcus azizii]|uniref:Endoribonuclease YoeB n=1 Tax=Streptococcus azizii TaxID=1579424 RepID=A0AB36JSJ3_9STRE|nr:MULTISPECIES: Txe/YoeB family addiction module toxin [Streptococcus]MBF0776727.1 Txe/YoeB family addiction module toxin [Streptococcus sp. 19428wD3_AN2]ONK29140.1 addiction module toxin YoeB [Streptococcus azizii]ONK29686.1 addiction module toxin YoeB [Streptococcus azizii]ONK30623.1 addiction module toxin YoeB [Streptococcus azizii]TFU82544.1 Txe/YoeB family addiction module toxin [Streptococcus sp. AN2]